MKRETIRRAFLDQADYEAVSSNGFRPSAALVPIEPGKGVWLTRRSALLPTHAGQVSFPGGKIEAADASPEMAALREAQEEVGLDPAQAEILGRLPDFRTGTGFHIASVVALLPTGVTFQPEAMEVVDVFALPFSALLNPAYPIRRQGSFRGVKRTFWVWPHQDHMIWGATAQILLWLALRLRAVR